MTAPTFDNNTAIQALREGQDLTGKDGILTPLIKQLTEAALNAELNAELV
jgi:putative transposase